MLYVSQRELKRKGKRGTWTETQYNLCNEAPAKFCTSAPVPTIPGSAFAKPWMGRGGRGTTGSPGLSQALGVGSHLSLRLDLLLFCKGILKQHFFNMGRSEIERPP
jgi:hypothetical protein